jgi:RND family efflux transporter MFP subunit
MRSFFKWVVPTTVLAVCLAIGITMIRTAPKAERRVPPPSLPTVEVMTLVPSNFPVTLSSQGTVAPRTESTLIPQVSGQIVRVSENFQSGGFFESGEILLEIDPRDYENSEIVARADLEKARATLDEEEARAAQARLDWKTLSLSTEPNALALREPQLKSARAAVDAAEARLEQARINLERTRIRAPYSGLVLEKNVDVGQYVSPSNVLARIYAVDLVEIRLPLTNDQLAFIDIPETYRDGAGEDRRKPPVYLSARVGGETRQWKGRVVRTEGAVDTQSQQIFVIAQVEDPYARHHGQPLKVGQFVEARIGGRVLTGVFDLPRAAVRRNGEVLVVGPHDVIERRRVDVVWSEADRVVVGSGLKRGERISLTPLPFAVSGTKVQVAGADPRAPSG